METWSQMMDRHADEKRSWFDKIAETGLSPKEICLKYGVSYGHIYSEFKKRNVNTSSKPEGRRNLTVTSYAKCASMGMTMMETARELGVTPSNVSQMAARHGIPFIKKQGNRKK